MMAAHEIAVIGMAARFPGADDVTAFWHNLLAGLPAHRAADPDPALFDADFFGIPPQEAEVTDPQHRLLLECCWHAVEAAGYEPAGLPAVRAVFAGCSFPVYLVRHVMEARSVIDRFGPRAVVMLNDRDALTARVAHLLDLNGPCLSVQAFSATGPAAVHLAVQSLQLGECDVALAGSASVHLPGSPADPLTTSPSGICRPLDARADGTLPGTGAGVVVLRRLADALADGDHVHAVIEGSAITTEGRARPGFLAQSGGAKAAAIVEAMAVADVSPGEIGFVETQAFGAPVNDALELHALEAALGDSGAGPWRIGSVAANVGHLDAAAGMAGLLKAILMVEHGWIPPQPGFRLPSRAVTATRPGLGPTFVVPTSVQPWPGDHGSHAAPGSPRGRRRAGVNSYGVGGTNVHLVVAQLPPRPASEPGVPAPAGRPELFVLSGRNPAAVRTAARRLHDTVADRWCRRPAGAEATLADLAFTLQTGRAAMPSRAAFVASTPTDVLAGLDVVSRGDHPPLPAPGPSHGRDGAGRDGAGRDADLADCARRWLAGESVAFGSLHAGWNRRRLPLPGYPFVRRRHWIEPETARQVVRTTGERPAGLPAVDGSRRG